MDQFIIKYTAAVLALGLMLGMTAPAAAEGMAPDSYDAILAEGGVQSETETFLVPQQEEESTAFSEEAVVFSDAASDPAVQADPGYAWSTMTDDEFAAFLRTGGYYAYSQDFQAKQSLYERLEQIADPALKQELMTILDAWMAELNGTPVQAIPAESVPEETLSEQVIPEQTLPEETLSEELPAELPEDDLNEAEFEEEMLMMAMAAPMTLTASDYVTAADLNASDMCMKQSVRGTCTLTAAAMMIRRVYRIHGWDYTTVTESSVRPCAWIDGTGMYWFFEYGSVSVGKADFVARNLEEMIALLQAHPEGIVAYDKNKPHAVLLSDYTNGILYCIDPASGKRLPVAESWLRINNSQADTIAGFDYYWYVKSPSSYLPGGVVTTVSAELSVRSDDSGTVTLDWSTSGAGTYYIFRSSSPDGPWEWDNMCVGGSTIPSSCGTYTDTAAEPFRTTYYILWACDPASYPIKYSRVVSVTPEPKNSARITKQLESLTIRDGKTKTLVIEAIGQQLRYTWQYFDGTGWVDAQTGDPEYTITASSELSGRRFRCHITNEYGADEYSSEAVITVLPALEGYTLNTRDMQIPEGMAVYINGIAQYADSQGNILVDEGAETAAIYSDHRGDAEDRHTWYPTGMQVWLLSCDDITGMCRAVYVPEFGNLLSYEGSSIRITGVKGIRVITGIPVSVRSSLLGSGIAGLTLEEYGTLACWADSGISEPRLDDGISHHNHAYSRSAGTDPVFRYAKDQVQYTNVLVGYSTEQCSQDILFRPYMILKDAAGRQITIYGGTVRRSIGYIAWQNSDAFKKGTAAYDYVHEIIDYVYGTEEES